MAVSGNTCRLVTCPISGVVKSSVKIPAAVSSSSHPLDFENIPTPRSLPLIGTTIDLLTAGGAPFLHKYCDDRHQSLGRLYREKIGNLDCVFIADAGLMQRVYSNEGQFPVHSVPEPWVLFNEMKGIQRGLFFMDGPEWSVRRKSLNRIFLKKEMVSSYSSDFNDVITDLLSGWTLKAKSKALRHQQRQHHTIPCHRHHRQQSQADECDSQSDSDRESGPILQDLERELYNWSIESLGTMIFGRRLGCVPEFNPSDTPSRDDDVRNIHEFVQCTRQLFAESSKMTVIPPKLAYRLNLPVWKRFVTAAETALSLARGYVENNVQHMLTMSPDHNRCPFHSNERSKPITGIPASGVLDILTNKEKIEKDEVVNIITDLFLAAADTTSHATQWALYLLARHPECQEKVLEEVNRVLEQEGTGDDGGSGSPGGVREEHLTHMPYVKGVIKECLRLYPVAPFLSRVLDKDITLNGFRVPAGKTIVMSLYTMGRDSQYFADPESFRPERWLRNADKKQNTVTEPQAFIPFGVGVRSCIGRRVAEMQMQFLLSRVVQKFRLKAATDKEVGIKLRMITAPEEPILLRLQSRRT